MVANKLHKWVGHVSENEIQIDWAMDKSNTLFQTRHLLSIFKDIVHYAKIINRMILRNQQYTLGENYSALT